MTARIMKHNPAFLSREELVQSFVARKDDLAFVLEHLADNTGASSQHLLIVAARGMGKTSLVLRTAEAVRTEERFSKSWFPLVYAEETYEVTSAGELWLEGVRHLGEQTKNPDLLAAYRELRRERDEQRLHDRALGLLLDFADQQKKRLLLVVENLHMLLGEQISKADAWRLRKTLQTERRLLLLATATASFDAIENVDQAFFDQFRTYRLDPLDLEGARHVWEHVAGAPVPPEQMRPLQILTGGNPRLLAILASFAGGMSLRELMGDLVRLVDDHTTYFKANLDSLPAKERKVYVTLADLWQPSLAREVAEQARLSPSEASALLNRLTQRGAVTASGEERRKTYQLAERMYNIYHLLRRSGGDDTRVRAVVDFMVGFYDPVSLGRVVRAIAQEGASLGEEDRRDHLLVMESLFRREANPRVRGLWAREASAHLGAWSDTPKALQEELARTAMAPVEWVVRASGLHWEELGDLLREGKGVFKNGWHGREHLRSIAQQAPGGDPAEAATAGVLSTLTRLDDVAVPALQHALQFKHRAPRRAFLLGCLGRSLMGLGRTEEAEHAFREAVLLSPSEPGLLANLAFCLARKEEGVREAEELARRAVEIDSATDLAWEALFVAFRTMSTSALASRESEYKPILDKKGAPTQDRVAAGLWAVLLWANAGNRRFLQTGRRAFRDAWNRGLRPWVVGLLLLRLSVDGEHDDIVSDVVVQLAASMDPGAIEQAFDTLWASNSPADHALAVPHLPVLLADPTLGAASLPVLGLLVVTGPWEEARNRLVSLIPPPTGAAESPTFDEKTRSQWTRIFIDVAATGHAREALELLGPSPLARSLEPVVAALHAILGEPYRAPQEIAEVARDVAERIRRRDEALKRRSVEPSAARTPRQPTPAKACAPSARGSRGKAVRRSGAVPPT